MKRHHCLALATLCASVLAALGNCRADDLPNTLDVTKKVQQDVKGNSLAIKADTNDLGDPIPHTQKRLKVEYTVNAAPNSKVVMEGAVLEIHPPKGAKLVVTRAVYGDLPDERKVDVTGQLTAAVLGDKLNLAVINDTMGGDPAPFSAKTLEVAYTVGGKPGRATAGEFTTLALPQPGEGAGKLVILSATYGDL